MGEQCGRSPDTNHSPGSFTYQLFTQDSLLNFSDLLISILCHAVLPFHKPHCLSFPHFFLGTNFCSFGSLRPREMLSRMVSYVSGTKGRSFIQSLIQLSSQNNLMSQELKSIRAVKRVYNNLNTLKQYYINWYNLARYSVTNLPHSHSILSSLNIYFKAPYNFCIDMFMFIHN